MFYGRNRLSESLPKEIVDQLEKLRQVERKLLKREPIDCLGRPLGWQGQIRATGAMKSGSRNMLIVLSDMV